METQNKRDTVGSSWPLCIECHRSGASRTIRLSGRRRRKTRFSPTYLLAAMAMAPSSSALPPTASMAWKTTTNGKSAQLQHAAKPIPAVDLPALQSAGRVLHDQLVKDAQAVPELGDMLTIRAYLSA